MNLRRVIALGCTFIAAAAASSCDGATDPVDRTPAALQILSGHEQEGIVGRGLAAPLVVRVMNADGDPLAGTLVNFVVVSGGGSVFAGAALTNASGIAQERWTLGTSSTTEQRVEARAVDSESGAPIVFATFTAKALPDAAAALDKLAGDGQQATAGSPVPVSPTVMVRDQYGNAVPGVDVAFAIIAGGGALQHSSATSDDAGRASAGTWTLGTSAQPQSVRASADDVEPVIFTATALAGAPSRLVIEGEAPTTTPSGAPLAPIVVRLHDAHGNIVRQNGVQVTAAVQSGAGSLAGTTTVGTDAEGRATFSALSVVGVAGEKTLRFSASSLDPASVVIMVTAGVPSSMTKVAGDGQAVVAGSAAAVSPSVRITDAAGNRLAGITVTFVIGSGGGSLVDAVRTTDVDGLATVGSWIVGTVPGAASLTATASGTAGVTFNATIVAGPSASMTKIAGDGQSATVGTAVSTAPRVRVTDAHGNPVAGTTVTFTVASGGGTVQNPSATTNSAGEASSGSWTLGTSAGQNTLQASVGGLSVLFSATGTPVAGLGARVTVISGNVAQALPRQTLSQQLVARVTDQHGNPLPDVIVTWTWFGGRVTPERALQCTSIEERLRGLRWCQTHWQSRTDEQGYVHATRALGNVIGDRQFTSVSYNNASASFEHPIADVFTADEIAMGGMKCVLEAGQPYCFTNGAAVPIAGAQTLVELVVGTSHACGLTSDGVAYCWGENRYGQLGDDGTSSRQVPAPVAGSVRFTSIASKFDHTCGLTSDGTAYCWGLNAGSQLGSSTPAQCTSPTGAAVSCALQPQAVTTNLQFRQVSAGGSHSCAIDQNGAAWCWGTGHDGQLGTGSRSSHSWPVAVSGGHAYRQIVTDVNNTCGLTTASILCWGTIQGLLQPTATRAVSAEVIALGQMHVCALEADGRLYCADLPWASVTHLYGVHGTGSNLLGFPEDGNGPGYVATSKPFAAVAATRFQTCGIAESGQVYCWGQNSPDASTFLPNYVHPPRP